MSGNPEAIHAKPEKRGWTSASAGMTGEGLFKDYEALINEAGINAKELWNNLEYVKFRDSFIQREMMTGEVYSLFADPAELKKIEKAQISEPPEPCRTCHKMLGV